MKHCQPLISKFIKISLSSNDTYIKSNIDSMLEFLQKSVDIKEKIKKIMAAKVFLEQQGFSFSEEQSIIDDLRSLSNHLKTPTSPLKDNQIESHQFLESKDLITFIANEKTRLGPIVEAEKIERTKKQAEARQKTQEERQAKQKEQQLLQQEKARKASMPLHAKFAEEVQNQKDMLIKRNKIATADKSGNTVIEFLNQNKKTELQGKAAFQVLAQLQNEIMSNDWNPGMRGRKIYDTETNKLITTVDKDMIPILDAIENAFAFQQEKNNFSIPPNQKRFANDNRTVEQVWLDTYKEVMAIGEKANKNHPMKFFCMGGYSPQVQKFFGKFNAKETNRYSQRFEDPNSFELTTPNQQRRQRM